MRKFVWRFWCHLSARPAGNRDRSSARIAGHVVLIAAIMPIASGCTAWRSMIRDSEAESVSALPLDSDLLKASNDSGVEGSQSAIKNKLLQDSMQKCWQFSGVLGFGERGLDTTFDVVTTSLAALGAVFTPVGTVRALSGAAAISNGSKSAIDADVYAKATSPLIVGAIFRLYWTPIMAYRDGEFKTADPASAASKILSLHLQCGLDPALHELNKDLGGLDVIPGVTASLTQLKGVTDASAALVKAAQQALDDSRTAQEKGNAALAKQKRDDAQALLKAAQGLTTAK